MPKHNSTTTMLNADRTVDKISKVWGGDPRSRRLQIVCGPCNNGWMSDLQTAAKPTLVPLITGKSIKSDIGASKDTSGMVCDVRHLC
jgi:hypothetical protein